MKNEWVRGDDLLFRLPVSVSRSVDVTAGKNVLYMCSPQCKRQ